MSLTLNQIGPGQVMFIDSNIFIYHFTGRSRSCGVLMERCETGEVTGVTGAHVVLEVLHRLMMLEAVQMGLVKPGNVVRRLRQRPTDAQTLDRYARHANQIPEMGIQVLAVDMDLVRASHSARRQTGILVNDSVSVAMMEQQSITAIATGDRDFQRVVGLDVYLTDDL